MSQNPEDIETALLEAPSALEHTLSLSYEERIEAHQAALELALELQRAGYRQVIGL